MVCVSVVDGMMVDSISGMLNGSEKLAYRVTKEEIPVLGNWGIYDQHH